MNKLYLKVLMDEVFEKDNLNSITVKTSSESGVKVNANKPVKVKRVYFDLLKQIDIPIRGALHET